MVERDDLLGLVADRARAEAEKRRLEEHQAEDLVVKAKAVVDDFFESLTWETVDKGETKSRDSLRVWRHRTISDVENDWRYLGIDRFGLRDAAERYLDQPWLQCCEIDWLVVDVLVYAEYQATLDFLRVRMMPLTRYLAGKLGTASSAVWSISWRMLVTAFKWAIWCAVAVIAGLVATPAGPIGLVIITVMWFGWKWRTRKKLNALMGAMFGTYAHLSTVSQGWQVLWRELDDSRKKGAVWDGVVYRLVETRMRAL